MFDVYADVCQQEERIIDTIECSDDAETLDQCEISTTSEEYCASFQMVAHLFCGRLSKWIIVIV